MLGTKVCGKVGPEQMGKSSLLRTNVLDLMTVLAHITSGLKLTLNESTLMSKILRTKMVWTEVHMTLSFYPLSQASETLKDQ